MKLLDQSSYTSQMESIVLPYIKARRESGYVERIPGQKMYYEHLENVNETRALVLVHGFTEDVEKFYETAYYFMQMGFSVWLYQQRGHGKSYRSFTKDLSRVHIDHYEDLVEDLHYFVQEVVMPAEINMPLYYYGHSMGGGVGAIYLETYPDDFPKAILSSPMFEIDSGKVPDFLEGPIMAVLSLSGETNYLPGGKPFDQVPDFENSCTNCRPRFNYYFEEIKKDPYKQMSAPTVRTAKEFLKIAKTATDPQNCQKVKAKVLLFQAGQDHTVRPGGENRFIEQIGERGQMVRIEKAKHEIYRCNNEDMELYWDAIEKFLG